MKTLALDGALGPQRMAVTIIVSVTACHPCILVFSSGAVIKDSDESNLEKEGSLLAYSSKLEAVMEDKRRQQELEALDES